MGVPAPALFTTHIWAAASSESYWLSLLFEDLSSATGSKIIKGSLAHLRLFCSNSVFTLIVQLGGSEFGVKNLTICVQILFPLFRLFEKLVLEDLTFTFKPLRGFSLHFSHTSTIVHKRLCRVGHALPTSPI